MDQSSFFAQRCVFFTEMGLSRQIYTLLISWEQTNRHTNQTYAYFVRNSPKQILELLY